MQLNYILAIFQSALLPLANEVWGKVIFLHLFVILFTGGSASVNAGRPPPPRRHPCPGWEIPRRRLPGGDPPEETPLPVKETTQCQADPPAKETPPKQFFLHFFCIFLKSIISSFLQPPPPPWSMCGRYASYWNATLPPEETSGAEHAGRYGQRAGGTHPTGMQSCCKMQCCGFVKNTF